MDLASLDGSNFMQPGKKSHPNSNHDLINQGPAPYFLFARTLPEHVLEHCKNKHTFLQCSYKTFKQDNKDHSGAHFKVCEHCFVKQKCQLQVGIAQYKNVTTQLSSKKIITTR